MEDETACMPIRSSKGRTQTLAHLVIHRLVSPRSHSCDHKTKLMFCFAELCCNSASIHVVKNKLNSILEAVET